MPPLLCNLDKINKLEDFDSLPLARLLWQYSTQSNRIQKASLTDVQVIHLSLLCRHAHKSHVLIVPLLGVMVLSDAPKASPLPLSSTSPFLPLLSFSPPLSLYTPTTDENRSLQRMPVSHWLIYHRRGWEQEWGRGRVARRGERSRRCNYSPTASWHITEHHWKEV